MAEVNSAVGIYAITADTDTIAGRLKVSYIRWVGGASASDSCIVTNTNGDVIFEGEADGANYTDLVPVFRWIDGIAIDTLDSGTVYVYTL